MIVGDGAGLEERLMCMTTVFFLFLVDGMYVRVFVCMYVVLLVLRLV